MTQPSRRAFLQRCLALAALPAGARADGRLAGVLPLLGSRPSPPLNRLLGQGLDARQFFDLSSVSADRLVVDASQFYVRTSVPLALATDRWSIGVAGGRGPATLPFADLRRDESEMGEVLLECAGNADPSNFGLMSAARWRGVPIDRVLEAAGPPYGARYVCLSGVDEHPPSRTSVPGAAWVFKIDDLVAAGAFLATSMNGKPLSPVHGYPVRLVVPGWYGCASIKWLNQIRFVEDDEPATSQMQEFAIRTFQEGRPALARDYRPVVIEHAATPIRVEKWATDSRIVHRVIGILWGGARPTNKLSIRFGSREPWVPVESCPLPRSTKTWTIWSHTWRPSSRGRYRIALRVEDRDLRTDRLDMFFYVRDVEIDAV